MKPTPTFLTVPEFCTAGVKTQPSGSRLATGYQFRDKPPSEEHNFLFNGLTANANTAESALISVMNELSEALSAFGITANAGVTNQLEQLFKKAPTEKRLPVGGLIPMLDYEAPVAWAADGSTKDTYFPAVCATNIENSVDIAVANFPDLVPWLRAKQLVALKGLTGETSAWNVTNWSVTGGNLATLTLANDSAVGKEIWFINTMAEDYLAGGSVTSRTITIPVAIGNIPAGDYLVNGASWNSVARTFTFPITATNGSGSVTSTITCYPFRVAGSTTTARVYSLKGLGFQGQGDANGYFSGGCIRTRDRIQGHWHDIGTWGDSAFDGTGGDKPTAKDTGAAGTVVTLSNRVTNPITDGTNGTPRTGKTTHSPVFAGHWYIHAGRYLP